MRLLAPLSISFALLLASCGMNTNTASPTDAPATPVQTTSPAGPEANLPTIEETFASIPEISKKDPRFISCIQPSLNSCLAQSVNDIAKTNQDVKTCDELKDPGLRRGCQRYVVTLLSKDQKNIKMCDSLEDASEASICRVDYIRDNAVNTQSTQACDDIKKLTENMPAQYNTCIYQVVQVKADAKESDCNAISDEALKNLCQTNVKNNAELRAQAQKALEAAQAQTGSIDINQ